MAEFINTAPPPLNGVSVDLPEALQAPTQPVSFGFMLALGAVEFAFFVCFLGIGSLLIPLQIGQLDPAHKIIDLSLFTGISVIVGLVATPVAGALSDRTTSRFGRRRPWLLAGGLLSAASLFIMMRVAILPFLFIGLCCFQLFSSLALAAVTAMIPDRVPEHQRGLVSAIFGLGVPLGGIVGVFLVGQVFKTPAGSYAVALLLVLLTTVPLGLFLPDQVLPRGYLPPLRPGMFLKHFWVSPRKYPDFAWTWLTRFIPFFGYFMGVNYILYYLQDAVKYSSPLQGAATFQIISKVTLMLATLLGGVLSDRLKRRKGFVVVSECVAAIALLMLAFLQSWPFVLIAAVILGLGVGVYLTVDVAITTLVLPSAESRAKDMGIVNIAQTLPQSLAPVMAGLILFLTHSYTVLYCVAAVFVLLGIAVVMQIKGVQ